MFKGGVCVDGKSWKSSWWKRPCFPEAVTSLCAHGYCAFMVEGQEEREGTTMVSCIDGANPIGTF